MEKKKKKTRKNQEKFKVKKTSGLRKNKAPRGLVQSTTTGKGGENRVERRKKNGKTGRAGTEARGTLPQGGCG